jgi:hypothetical protein
VQVLVDPARTRVWLTVERIGDAFHAPPPNLQRYYRSQTHLLPVYLRPRNDHPPEIPLRLGCEVGLPYEWPRWAKLFFPFAA